MRHAGSRASKWLLLAVLLGSVGLTNCGARERPSEPAEDDSSVAERPLEPLPLVVDFNRVRAELGERLFRDPRLSGDAKVACADCHHEGHGLADDKPHSVVANRHHRVRLVIGQAMPFMVAIGAGDFSVAGQPWIPK